MEILLTGEQIPAARAVQMGLVNKVVPRAELEAEALRYARILTEVGPLAVQAIKKSVLAGRNLLHAAALEKEMELGIPVSMSEDCREGTKAFKEKRKPVFRGR
jgi:enoyl-CoA hydratase/carnithine racemase